MPLAPPLIEEMGAAFAKMRMPRFLMTGRNGGGLRLGVAMKMRLSGTLQNTSARNKGNLRLRNGIIRNGTGSARQMTPRDQR
jgi:hypothetical protein